MLDQEYDQEKAAYQKLLQDYHELEERMEEAERELELLCEEPEKSSRSETVLGYSCNASNIFMDQFFPNRSDSEDNGLVVKLKQRLKTSRRSSKARSSSSSSARMESISFFLFPIIRHINCANKLKVSVGLIGELELLVKPLQTQLDRERDEKMDLVQERDRVEILDQERVMLDQEYDQEKAAYQKLLQDYHELEERMEEAERELELLCEEPEKSSRSETVLGYSCNASNIFMDQFFPNRSDSEDNGLVVKLKQRLKTSRRSSKARSSSSSSARMESISFFLFPIIRHINCANKLKVSVGLIGELKLLVKPLQTQLDRERDEKMDLVQERDRVEILDQERVMLDQEYDQEKAAYQKLLQDYHELEERMEEAERELELLCEEPEKSSRSETVLGYSCNASNIFMDQFFSNRSDSEDNGLVVKLQQRLKTSRRSSKARSSSSSSARMESISFFLFPIIRHINCANKLKVSVGLIGELKLLVKPLQTQLDRERDEKMDLVQERDRVEILDQERVMLDQEYDQEKAAYQKLLQDYHELEERMEEAERELELLCEEPEKSSRSETVLGYSCNASNICMLSNASE
ncbi:myosin-11-like [Daphnia pulex]|uniref:myosin-11-like n=1 Tax=Daphnia pulex TaxID=6669 RepID=UPI001EE10935|nr:myosin-11-like [Daphnia pulex]